MLCADRRDLILLLASGALEAAEERELRAHLATGCPQCAGYVAEAQAVWSQIPMGLTPVMPSPAARELLRIKVEGTMPQAVESGPIPISRGRQPSPVPAPKKWGAVFAASGIAAAVAAGITFLALNGVIKQKDDLLRQRDAELSGLKVEVKNASSVINMLHSPDTMIVNVPPVEKSPAEARMLWNAKSNTGVFVGSNLKPAAPGRCYELWLIVGDKPADKLAAGKVEVSPSGDTTLSVAWKDPVHPVIFALTDEPDRPNIVDPQGPAVMVGKIN